jgi:hypothetical protein
MDAQNKWTAARKVMKEVESRRGIFESICECLQLRWERESQCDGDAGGNALGAICALV